MRDYDPSTGRYIQGDPLGLVDGPSVYGYVTQSPDRYFDLRGERMTPPVFPPVRTPPVRPGTAPTGQAAGTTPHVPPLPAEDQCHRGECPPCMPYPKGTVGYREDFHSNNAGVGYHHLNLYIINQNPRTCVCRWNKAKPHHVDPPPMPHWIKLKSAGRGPRDTFPDLWTPIP